MWIIWHRWNFLDTIIKLIKSFCFSQFYYFGFLLKLGFLNFMFIHQAYLFSFIRISEYRNVNIWILKYIYLAIHYLLTVLLFLQTIFYILYFYYLLFIQIKRAFTAIQLRNIVNLYLTRLFINLLDSIWFFSRRI